MAGVAGALGLDDAEGRSLVDGDAARAAAGGTGLGIGTGLRACSVTVAARVDAVVADLLGDAPGALLKGDGDARLDVAAALGSVGAASAAEAAAEEAREDVAEVHVNAEGTAAACACAVVGVYARVAVLVIARALFAVGKHLIGFVDLLELLLAVLVAGVKVGVIFFGALSVSLFYLVIARSLVKTEHLVIISFICHWIHSFLQSFAFIKASSAALQIG